MGANHVAYHIAQSEILPRRTLAAGGIILLHLLVIYLLITALMRSPGPPELPHLVARVLAEPTPVPATPNVTVHDLHGPPVTLETPPVPTVVFPPEPVPAVVTPSVQTPAAGSAGAAPGPVRLVGRNILPDSEDYYPADRKRLGIEGAALVRVCVDERGARAGEPLIETSSQDAQLDAAALNVARHGRYARAQQDGAAVPNCYRFHIVFRQAAH
jgi:TonB family protein